MYEFAGLQCEPFSGDFKTEEHHILGNRMRLESGVIRMDERWRRDLSPRDRKIIEKSLLNFASTRPQHTLSSIIRSYVEGS